MSTTTLPVTLGVGWGALALVPIGRRARRHDHAARARALRPSVSERDQWSRRRWLRRPTTGAIAALLGPVGRVATGLHRHRAARRDAGALARELPVAVDLLAVAVGAGCTPFLAVEVAARWAPPRVAARLEAVLRSCSLGAGFADALGDLGAANPALRGLVDALRASDQYGAPVGDALARLARDERASLRRRAEARARTVPVRLLFPLVFLVLPAFGLLTVAPALLTGFAGH